MSMESSLWERDIWSEPEPEGLLDILIGEGGKVSLEDGEEGGEFVGVVKFDTMGAMSEY